MQNFNTTLDNCSAEPIHIPGKIQAHGFLLVINSDLNVTHHSENIAQFLTQIPEDVIGRNIVEIEPLIGKNEPANFIHQLIVFGKANGFEQTNPFNTDIQGHPYFLIISPAEGSYLLEFEPAISDLNVDVQKMIGRTISEMLSDKNLQSLLKNTSEQVKKVIGYDRVMVYKFHEDGHGEVVSEARAPELESWLGLHYPATDIPKQARELYKKNPTRIIADVEAVPVPVRTDAGNVEVPLDLTYSQLRAVSPIHIQYLKNMKVASSFSISLLYHGELWGLIACHNYSPKFIDYKSRESSRLIGQILSSALEFRQDEENQQQYDKLKTAVDVLSKFMLKSNSIETALTQNPITLLNAVEATGAVLLYENSISVLGEVPDGQYLSDLLSWIRGNVEESLYYTNQLALVYPPAGDFLSVAAGMMVSVISKELGEYAIWFKPEILRHIKWAGDPSKPVEIENGVMSISPRKSFEVWSEAVTKTSHDWSSEEIKSVVRLKGEMLYAINQKASEIRILNDKLKQAYEELDTFSFTISHDLKNPLSTIKSYSQILKRDKNIQEDSQKLLDRVVAGADKMNYMIREVLEYSRIGKEEIVPVAIDMRQLVDELLKDLRVVYADIQFEVSFGDLPDVHGDPLMISQVFSNLLSNAIKYSNRDGTPRIGILGARKDGELIYEVRDNGIGIDIKQLPHVFDLFKRMSNVADIEGTGVGLAIVKRIVGKHNARIWVDSQLGKGTTFYIAF